MKLVVVRLIDRGSMSNTILGKNTYLDNQIADNTITLFLYRVLQTDIMQLFVLNIPICLIRN